MHNSRLNSHDDALSQFFFCRCEVGPDWKEGKGEFFEKLDVWCCSNGFSTPSMNAVSEQMKQKGFTEHRTKSKRFWVGLRLKEVTLDYPALTNDTTTTFENSTTCIEPSSCGPLKGMREPAYHFDDAPCHVLIRRAMGVN